jgi:hypothetical protein
MSFRLYALYQLLAQRNISLFNPFKQYLRIRSVLKEDTTLYRYKDELVNAV